MLRKIPFAVILLISLAACKSKTAFNYSQDFVKKEQSLLPDLLSTGTKVSKYMAREQYDSVAAAGERMEKIIDAKLQEIKNQPAPDVKEGENFKAAGVKYFSYMKSIYTSYKKIGNAKTTEERNEEMNKLKQLTYQRVSVLQNMQAAQREYAKANGFRVENK